MCLFFFFQAEDGIRDVAVTGVQTCALPIAVAQDHTVYVAYFGWRSNAGSDVTSDVVVVRDDNGATGATPFRDLVDPSDHFPGRLVATHVTIPWSNAPTLGQERIGSTLSIAVDALHSDNVYLAWADRVGTGDIYTVHVRRSTDRGATWSGDLRTLTNATDASVVVSTNGTTGLLYQQVTGSASTSRWVTRLEQSRDGFATQDRKSTRLNSSDGYISYAVFCLKKKKKINNTVKLIYEIKEI